MLKLTTILVEFTTHHDLPQIIVSKRRNLLTEIKRDEIDTSFA